MSQGLLDAQNGHPDKRGVTRRTFLKFGFTVGAAAGGGLMLGFSFPAAGEGQGAPGTQGARSVIGGDGIETPQDGVFAPNAFVQIDRSGKVTLVMPKVEMGQGVYTALPMLIAEELEVRWDQVRVEQLDFGIQAGDKPDTFTNRYGSQFAGGSTNISDGWTSLREAGAQVRELLILAAAQAWGAQPGSLTAREGVVRHADGRRATYGELASRAAKLPLPAGPFTLKDRKDFRIIGRPTGVADCADIVSGRARYGSDASVPAMLFAVIALEFIAGRKLWRGTVLGRALAPHSASTR